MSTIPIVFFGGSDYSGPVSVSVRTSSYTIPAGRYARVIANVEGSSSFTINGGLALRGTSNTVLSSDNLRLATDGNFISNKLATSDTAPGGWSSIGTAFNESTNQTVSSQDYILPSGTVISGSGTWRAVVEEYEE